MNVLVDLVKHYAESMPKYEDSPAEADAEIEAKRVEWAEFDSAVTAAVSNLEYAEMDLKSAIESNDSELTAELERQRDESKRDLELLRQDELQARTEYLAAQTRWGF